MKKQLLIIVLTCCVGSAIAQTLKGDRLVGGSGFVGINSDNFLFELRPDIGWFIKDNLVLGSSATLYYNKYFDSSSTTNLSVGPFVRYYFTKEGRSRFYGFGNTGFGWQLNKFEGNSDNYFLFNAAIGPGYAYFITNQVALEANTGYILNMGSGFDTEHRFFISLGFQIHLLKK